jgi:hypothetical protein
MPAIRFQSRENRDRFIRENRGYRARSARNVTLSPDYVADFTGTPTPNGFGGASPQYFSVVYIAERR